MRSKSVAAGTEHKEHEVAPFKQTRPQLAKAPGLEEIRRRAYEIHIERGGTPGRELDDWLQAERELVDKFKAS